MPTTLESKHSTMAYLRAPPREQYEAGRARRETVPLEAHGELSLGTGRADPLAIHARQDRGRLAEVVPLRYGRMSRTPFTYLRGAAEVMASDLAAGPRSDLWVELCGDAHLGNFRWFRAPDRELVFDLNDFDETLPGPFEWDVKRLAASVSVAARSNGFSKEKCRAATRAALRSYRQSIAEASELGALALYYFRFESGSVLDRVERHGKAHRKWKKKVIGKAVRKNSLQALDKLTAVVDGRRVIRPDPPLIVRADERLFGRELQETSEFFERYRDSLPLERRVLIDRFSLVDVARKVVGVGSVGLRCLILLLEAGDGTPLFLQFKQASASVLEPHLGKSVFDNAGRRVVEGQQLMQAASDSLLGWSRWQNPEGRDVDFYIRQLWDGKGKVDVEEMAPKRLAVFAGLCGKTLAYAQARSGAPMMIRGYIGEDETFDDVMVAFAERYAECTWRDHAALCQAIDEGAIEAIRDL
jgi:uncharacterized protein (DUF2252 family)